MLKYYLLVNLTTAALILSVGSFFTTIEHNPVNAKQNKMRLVTEEIVTEKNSVETEIINDYALNTKDRQFISDRYFVD